MDPKGMIFVDGENLVFRYQAMLETGRIPKEDVIHEQDTFVWSPAITNISAWNLIRTSYYTSVVGDELRLQQLTSTIASIGYRYNSGSGFVNPHIFKKQARGQKTKSVDINLVTDLLRHCYNHSVDDVFILSGDGDYIPTIHEVMRQGLRVFAGAFSSGLDDRIKTHVDEFFDLDAMFFQPHES